VARGFSPMIERAREALRRRLSFAAIDGRFELDKTSAKFEGVEARWVYGLPSHDEMPL
jgi:hypothetical protein